MLNFGTLASTKPTTTNKYLAAYTIHENVTIKGSEIKTGTSVNGNAWKSLVITFGNDDGIYNESIFWITSESDFERKSYDMPNGGTRMSASNWEVTSAKMAAIGFAYFPEAFAKIQAISSKAKSFDDIMSPFKKCIDSVVDKTSTNMKLVGKTTNVRVYAALPNCIGIAQANDEKTAERHEVNVGDWYTWMTSPFGENLSFTAYELKKVQEMKSATPTPMENSDSVGIVNTTPEEDDLDSLLANL